MAKDYFRSKGIKFDDINVGKDRAAAMEMVEKSGQMGVPVIDIDGELIIGFDVPKIESILSKVSRAEKETKPAEPGEEMKRDEAEAQKEAIKREAIEEELVEEASQKNVYDVLIIGGSAAGLTAALFAARREMKTLVVTKDIGGQISETLNIENYPGVEKIEGPELVKVFEAQAKKHGADIVREEIVEIEERDEIGERDRSAEGKLFFVKTKDGDEYVGRSVILAMGKTPRSLDVPGEETFLGKGISYCANCDAPLFRDKTVAVVGGGNAAFDAALLLSKIAKKVYIIHRREGFRAFEKTVEQVRQQPNVEFVLNSVVKEIRGDSFARSVVIEEKSSKAEKELGAEGVFVEIGSEVETEFVEGFVELDGLGQVKTNKNTETSKPGVFAAGDVADTPFKQIVTAAGDGCKAALAAYNYLHDIENKYVAEWSAHKHE